MMTHTNPHYWGNGPGPKSPPKKNRDYSYKERQAWLCNITQVYVWPTRSSQEYK